MSYIDKGTPNENQKLIQQFESTLWFEDALNYSRKLTLDGAHIKLSSF